MIKLRYYHAVLVLIPAFILIGCSGKEQDSGRPNILFILTDDQSQIDMGAYGNTVLETPNMDRLARESMVFENAFTSTAMCVPSRTSLYTGLHPMRHGAHPNHAPVRSSVTSVANHLDELGYKVGLIGKVHVNPDSTFNFHYLKYLLDFAWDVKLTREEMLNLIDA